MVTEYLFESTVTARSLLQVDTLTVFIVMEPKPNESSPSNNPLESLLIRLQGEQREDDVKELERLVWVILRSKFRQQLSTEDLEELRQEVTFKLVLSFRNRSKDKAVFEPRGGGDAAAMSWLRMVCLRAALDQLRANSRFRKVDLLEELNGEAGGHMPAVNPEFDAWLEKWSELQLVLAALTQLSAREQTILKMTSEGHSDQNTAEHLGLSPGSIPTLRARAIEKLRRMLAAVAQLSAQEQTIIIMTWRDHADRDIAEHLSLNPGSIPPLRQRTIEKLRRMLAVLAQLSPQEQTIIVMTWQDHADRDIAERLELSVSSIPTLRVRAIEELRRLIGEDEERRRGI